MRIASRSLHGGLRSLYSCKAVSGIFKKSLKRWEEWVAENKRAPLIREKALELTDLWARSLGGQFGDVASTLVRCSYSILSSGSEQLAHC